MYQVPIVIILISTSQSLEEFNYATAWPSGHFNIMIGVHSTIYAYNMNSKLFSSIKGELIDGSNTRKVK